MKKNDSHLMHKFDNDNYEWMFVDRYISAINEH